MGGIGKTTLAKVVYNQLSRDFANCCFLADVRDTSNSKGIVSLQNQLISELSNRACSNVANKEEGMRTIKERFSSKKILLLLDDIDDESQLTALLGGQGCFGPGSIILITTRNEIVLRAFQVKFVYHVDVLDSDRSLELFSKHAFRRDHPPQAKLKQSREIVEIAQGLPLLLEVMGSALSLYGQTEEMWDDYLQKWKKGPMEKIRNKLMISYEALDPNQRQIFLDIACFFVGYDKNIVTYMWKDCGLSPTEGLQVLQLMSLIKIGEDNKIWMCEQLKELGREIVSQESGEQLEKQSRLWNHKEGLKVLLRNKINEKLQALRLLFENTSDYCFNLDRFAALPKLRFLHMDSRHIADEVDRLSSELNILWNNKSLVTSLTNSVMGNKQLLPDLRWFSWHNFPQRILQISNFSLINLVILDFSRSKITHDWNGWKYIKKAEKLKVLNLSGCELLTRTPNFSGFPKLERLILERCERLAAIHPSIGQMDSLVFLNLNFCSELQRLPQELGGLSALTELLLDGTSIREIPDWVLKNLKKLSLDATPIARLPETIGALTSLERLSLNWCSQMGRLPHSIKELRSLIQLDLLETGITELPDSMESLENLKEMKLSVCYGSGGISALPKLPISLISLVISSPSLITIPDLSNLINLQQLLLSMGVPDISGPSEPVQPQEPMPWWIGRLSKLEVLTLTIPQMTNLSPELGELPRLRSLHLSGCHALECIPRIPSSVSKLHLIDCPSLTTLDISYLKKLSELYVVATPLSLEDLSGKELLDNLLECNISADYAHDLQAHLRSKMLEQHGLRKNIVGLRTREMDRGYLTAIGKYKKMFL
ncbi:disease resistance protein RUN1-like [Rhodamnia argentea]|uniref:Disease resistance protein RUN1-like n=1 Tax=Rhodamnia argentea TaxID=178133 RepID=A0ABM3HCI4_9MYRT|nr:disease resistance protein RUN1-like [Rhodamnia argentea]